MSQHRATPSWVPSKSTAKAVCAASVTLAAYLIGVIPAEGGFADVSVVQWLGAVVFLGGAYGLTYRVDNVRRDHV